MNNKNLLFFYRRLWLYHNGADFGNWKPERIKKTETNKRKTKMRLRMYFMRHEMETEMKMEQVKLT